MRRAAGTLTAAALLATGLVAGCGASKPDDCQAVPAAAIVDLTSPDAQLILSASEIATAASLDRDGGTYVMAKLSEDDSVLAWFTTPEGATFSVGEVTALYSAFPDSAEHTQAGYGTDGYDDAAACLG